MQTHITPNNKIASLGTVGLLFLAGIAGMVFLLPLNSAHAAGATITPSVTSGTVGQFITLTGTGFAPGQVVGIEFGTTLITVSGQAGAYPTVASLVSNVAIQNPAPLSVVCPCIETDANGYFTAVIAVPPVVGGAQTITATDGANTATAAFTVNPNITIVKSTFSALTSGLVDSIYTNAWIVATGFAASDTITLSTAAFTNGGGIITNILPTAGSSTQAVTLSSTSRTGLLYTAGPGISALQIPLWVSETAGGKLAVTASGTGGVASTSFTVNPVIALFNSQTGSTVFSMLNGGSLLLAGYGFPAGTIAAGAISITTSTGTSVTTQSSPITVGSTGTFGSGSGNHVVAIPNSLPALGPASIVITDGSTTSTFNYASHNIAGTNCGAANHVLNTKDCAGNTLPTSVYENSGNGVTGNLAPFGFGSPFIVSAIAVQGSSTALGYLSTSSVQPNSATYVTFFGTNYPNGQAIYVAPSVSTAGGTAVTFGAPVQDDGNGAFFVVSEAAGVATAIGEEPYSSTGYTVTTPTGLDGSALSPTLSITPWIALAGTTISAQSLGNTVIFHGFDSAATCTAAVGTTTLTLAAACTIGATGTDTNGAINVNTAGDAAGVLDLPGGANTITGSDGTVTGTAGLFVLPSDGYAGVVNLIAQTALSVNSAAPGQVTNLRTGLTTMNIPFGVHGLTPNTAFNVVIDPGQTTQTTLGTFTSTAAGGIPAPGVQFAIPVGSAGMHVVGLMQGTTNVFWNAVATTLNGGTTVSTTALSLPGILNPSVYDASGNQITQLSANVRGQYGDGVLNIGANLLAAPSAVTVGSTSSILTISGSGVVAGTTYYVSVAAGAANPPTCPLTTAGNVVAGTFTATSTGSVPAATTIQLVDTATALNGELGTAYCAYASTATQYPGASSGVATFDIQASASLNMTSAPAGHGVVISTHGLNANLFYNILFNPQTSVNGIVTGQIVGGVLTNSVGAASATFNIPTGATPGSYAIQLQSNAQLSTTRVDFANAPTVTVGGTFGTCTNEGTACMGISGTPVVSTSGANTIITTSFTNNSNAPQTAYIYGVVHNALGQTVAYTTATVSPAAGASQSGQLVLFGLAHGTYSVTLFAVSTSGTALSTSTSVSVTV